MHYYFLKEDFDKLENKIEEIKTKMKNIFKEIGNGCQETSETYHDNFAYESGQQQSLMWSEHLGKLIAVRNNLQIVTPDEDKSIATIGKTVTIVDLIANSKFKFKIGSYMTFVDDDSEISYKAPIATIVIGAKVGEVKEGTIAGKLKKFEIIKIE
jgi:transcription elongation GreA/GreB family factor